MLSPGFGVSVSAFLRASICEQSVAERFQQGDGRGRMRAGLDQQDRLVALEHLAHAFQHLDFKTLDVDLHDQRVQAEVVEPADFHRHGGHADGRAGFALDGRAIAFQGVAIGRGPGGQQRFAGQREVKRHDLLPRAQAVHPILEADAQQLPHGSQLRLQQPVGLEGENVERAIEDPQRSGRLAAVGADVDKQPVDALQVAEEGEIPVVRNAQPVGQPRVRPAGLRVQARPATQRPFAQFSAAVQHDFTFRVDRRKRRCVSYRLTAWPRSFRGLGSTSRWASGARAIARCTKLSPTTVPPR